jgi:hypothetical protein
VKEQGDIAITVTHAMLDQMRGSKTQELLNVIAAASALLLSRRISTDRLFEAVRVGEAALVPMRKGKPSTP